MVSGTVSLPTPLVKDVLVYPNSTMIPLFRSSARMTIDAIARGLSGQPTGAVAGVWELFGRVRRRAAIPADIVILILQFLPLSFVVSQCTSVCRLWESLALSGRVMQFPHMAELTCDLVETELGELGRFICDMNSPDSAVRARLEGYMENIAAQYSDRPAVSGTVVLPLSSVDPAFAIISKLGCVEITAVTLPGRYQCLEKQQVRLLTCLQTLTLQLSAWIVDVTGLKTIATLTKVTLTVGVWHGVWKEETAIPGHATCTTLRLEPSGGEVDTFCSLNLDLTREWPCVSTLIVTCGRPAFDWSKPLPPISDQLRSVEIEGEWYNKRTFTYELTVRVTRVERFDWDEETYHIPFRALRDLTLHIPLGSLRGWPATLPVDLQVLSINFGYGTFSTGLFGTLSTGWSLERVLVLDALKEALRLCRLACGYPLTSLTISYEISTLDQEQTAHLDGEMRRWTRECLARCDRLSTLSVRYTYSGLYSARHRPMQARCLPPNPTLTSLDLCWPLIVDNAEEFSHRFPRLTTIRHAGGTPD